MKYQGVLNVMRFNWPYYLMAFLLASVFFIVYQWIGYVIFAVAGFVLIAQALVSITVSHIVYDRSKLYEFAWLDQGQLKITDRSSLVNIHAGFDETSLPLADRFPVSKFQVFDFFESRDHTEPSIRRARLATSASVNAVNIRTRKIPLQDASVDICFVIFAAHEIRDDSERIAFFKELERAINSSGRIVVTEHIRDVANALAYNLGSVHFLTRPQWLTTFAGANLRVSHVIRTIPFVTTFVLEKNGTAR